MQKAVDNTMKRTLNESNDSQTERQASSKKRKPSNKIADDESTITTGNVVNVDAPKTTTAPSTVTVAKTLKVTSNNRALLLQAIVKSKESSNTVSKAVSSSPTIPPPVQSRKSKLATTTTTSKISPKQQTVKLQGELMGGLTELQAKMKKALSGGRFRMINEKLYTTTSDVAVKLFKKEPETFEIYHAGFRAQVESWPSNPVNHFIDILSVYKPENHNDKKPIVIVDMGCGEAALAKSLMTLNTPAHQKFHVHSFDLASPNEYVVACDIRSVPLKNKVADVVVFSLSLMGTNFIDFLREAHRIMKDGGLLQIAEVISRFPNVNKFIAALVGLGFKLKKKDASNKMFILFDFVKQDKGVKIKGGSIDEEGIAVKGKPLLTPCLYRKR
ncbi:25S rRNA (adenine645-N1)-methyltransferase [Physocladia obscura]|uniref:Ribosomal RNA-processing protein 8 n=1 Tax=Physocladia obscura TaxID=109957 RepID=A0AAD5T5P6_9FUNG|nr:25S rRNA (adenine645-N1)-methyltransferase [Physocladia obscura]